MTVVSVFEEINEAKANLDHVYDQADPRAYCRELRGVDYAIPGEAKPIFQKLIGHLREVRKDTIHVLDIGCSYGVNAALLKHDLSIEQLYAHWGQKTLASASSREVIENDKCYFADLEDVEDLEVIGLDSAENAIAFAEEAGLIDDGLALNLENTPLPEAAKRDLAPVDLVTSTGCVGYVTEKSFERLLPAVSKFQKPWFANFVLRMFPFDTIEKTLDDAGYATEKLEGRTFKQRAFASGDEQAQILEQLRELGIDPAGKEADGYLHAEFYLSRPKEDVTLFPIDELATA